MKGLFTIDVEPTNRCNARCHFCPRDATPHQGLMRPEVFAQTLRRAIELREQDAAVFDADIRVSLCGLGEPLLNPLTPSFAKHASAAGFECVVSTNGALLDERRGEAILEAGVRTVNVNVGDEGADYEAVYQLPFEKTRDRVLRFAEMARGRCKVQIVLVDHRHDLAHLEKMMRYWRAHGLDDFVFFDVINRAGALFVDHMQFASYPEHGEAEAILRARAGRIPICIAPFVFLFVGYDGNYYLCCSDWKKEVPLGSVFDVSFHDVILPKLDAVATRQPICKTCNWDPLNRLTQELRAIKTGHLPSSRRDDLVEEMVTNHDGVLAALDRLLEADRSGPPSASQALRTSGVG